MPVYNDDNKKRYFYITKSEDEYGNLVGRMATRTGSNDDMGIKFVNSDGVVSYRRHYPAIGGILIGIVVEKRKGKSGDYYVWEISMDAGDGETFVLSINLQSSSSNSIMHRLPSCNLKEEIKFRPYYFSDKDKIITGVEQINNDGKWQKIDKYWAYDEKTKTTTNGMPEMIVTENKVTGKKEYDDQAQNAFMWKYFQDNILPVLKVNAVAASVESPHEAQSVTQSDIKESIQPDPPNNEDVVNDIGEDDLPF